MGFNSENNIRLDPSLLSGIEIAPLIGESIWHSIVTDPSILSVSWAHYQRIQADINRFLPGTDFKNLRILEVGAYAHTSGYMLAQELGCSVTLFDLSANTLRKGYQMALESGRNTELVTRVAGDFHELPFEDHSFDVVYACSTLHHTWRWKVVLNELMRVATAGGILILENEPVLREFSFYNFRLNRVGEFSPAQKVFDKYGLTRTIGEPYGGSRPEMLFGMIENHQMPLGSILSEASRLCQIEEISLTALEMNSFEEAAHQAFCQGATAARHFITHDLSERIAVLANDPDLHTGGPATPLPSPSAIQAMADKIAVSIESEGYGQSSRMPRVNVVNAVTDNREDLSSFLERDPDLTQKISNARMFGAGMRLVSRRLSPPATPAIRASTPTIGLEKEGIRFGFSDRIQTLLDSAHSLLPRIQALGPELTRMEYGPDWQFAGDGEIHVLCAAAKRPHITVRNPRGVGNFLVAFRIQVVGGGSPWRLHLYANAEHQCWVDVVQTESTLLLATVPNVHGALTVEFDPTLLDNTTPPARACYSISQALAFTF